MNLSLYIARRYLFSKKTHNAINVISIVAVCAIAVATMAMVCTLSVFNGFTGMVSEMFSSFDPELKISPVKGKVFDPTDARFNELYSMDEIEFVVETLEENVLLQNDGQIAPAMMKGVSDNFNKLTHFEDILFAGEYYLQDEINDYGIVGIGLASRMAVYANQRMPITLYVPKRNEPVNMVTPQNSFKQNYLYISGVFMVNQEIYDANYIIVPLSLARELYDYPVEVSALEIKLKDGAKLKSAQKKMSQILGDEYYVKDRYQQQAESFRMMSIEKWVTYLMLCCIILIAAFNIIGSLSMIIADKQKDIKTLRNMGADNKLIMNIFLFEGWLISGLGAILGIVLGVLLCLGQQTFGWLQLGTGGNILANAYPVQLQLGDILLVFVSVITIGFLVVLYPVKYLNKRYEL